MSPILWPHTGVSFHTEAYFVAEGTATDTTDGSDTNGPTRNPPPQTSGHPAHVSPTIPAVVVIMNHVTLLEMLGLARKPHLWDVGLSNPQVLRTAGEGDWHMLTPLSATKLASMRTADPQRSLVPASRSVASHATVPQKSLSIHPARRPQYEPGDSLQVAILVAMPFDASALDHSGSSTRKSSTIPPLCVGVTDVKYWR
ncbi:hypothetical protein FKP32DRAFT_249387 [Trametes sanguinea]|nr:hypothetical protein FKP32DRAFT_249387 [Trametes sanguinea]